MMSFHHREHDSHRRGGGWEGAEGGEDVAGFIGLAARPRSLATRELSPSQIHPELVVPSGGNDRSSAMIGCDIDRSSAVVGCEAGVVAAPQPRWLDLATPPATAALPSAVIAWASPLAATAQPGAIAAWATPPDASLTPAMICLPTVGGKRKGKGKRGERIGR
uniref:Uncharacterized protein n=1 Tax=Oryza punctata TaxID=4537 RepID=A0A0E0LAA4_ORYPU